MYKLYSDSEQCATVGLLRELLNCRDGINDIEYLRYDEITHIIDEPSTNLYVLYSPVNSRVFYIVFYDVILFFIYNYCTPCTNKGDDDD